MDENFFVVLVKKLSQYSIIDTNQDSVNLALNNIFNELNSLDYRRKFHINDKAVFNLFEFICLIPKNEDILMRKAVSLSVALTTNQEIILPLTTIHKLINWLYKCSKWNCTDIVLTWDLLKALNALLRSHPHSCHKFPFFLAEDNFLISLLSVTGFKISEEIVLSSLLCIEAMVISFDNIEITYPTDIIGNKIINLLYTSQNTFHNWIHHSNFISCALKVMRIIANKDNNWCRSNAGELLGIIKTYIHFGFSDYVIQEPEKVFISQQTVVELTDKQTNKGGKVAKTRKIRKKNMKNDKKTNFEHEMNHYEIKLGHIVEEINSCYYKTSDSDFSDTEVNRTQREKIRERKLRQNSIALFSTLAKIVDKKVMYGYWHAIFPSDSKDINQNGIFKTVLYDPSPKCRCEGLQLISILLYGSKPFLMQAENSMKTPTSFMPFSITLGNMVISMFELLTKALAGESSLPVLSQALKCLAVLIQVTPFHKLCSGFTSKFLLHLQILIYHKDPTIQISALLAMGVLISLPNITKEISDFVGIPHNNIKSFINPNQLNDSAIDEIIEGENKEIIESDSDDGNAESDLECTKMELSGNQISWLLQIILENLGNSEIIASTPIRVECLQILSSMAQHFLLLRDHLINVANVLKKSLNDIQDIIRLNAAKCLDACAYSIKTFLVENASTKSYGTLFCHKFWDILLHPAIEKLQDPSQTPQFKSILCDFLSNIGVHVFEQLNHSTHIKLISLLSGFGCNEEKIICASAIRALAIYMQFPSLRENIFFAENTAESTLLLMKNPVLLIRIKAAWAMGNITDVLISTCHKSKLDSISDELLQRILITSNELVNDSDKVRSNIVRTLGNLLRLINENHLKIQHWRELIMKTIKNLIYNITTGNNSKVKWNTCYAVGNLLQNRILFTKYTDLNWQPIVFEALSSVIINNPNFKVRINGAAALGVITRREDFGVHLPLVWSSLLSALEQSEILADFNEYNHRDNLQEQLCLTICNIIRIVSVEDFPMLKNDFVCKIEIIKAIWNRVSNRVRPENAAPLLSCDIILKDIKQMNTLTAEQKKSVEILETCFRQADVIPFQQ